jgi:hypothetical protein
MTAANKRGAHNGYTAAGGVNSPGLFDQATFRRDNGGQPGTTWDLWNTRAGESQTTGSAWIGNRAALAIPPGDLTAGFEARTGPTGAMLQRWYRSILVLSGAAISNIFGRTNDRTDDDILVFSNFVTGATPRSVAVIGSGFCEALTQTPPFGPVDGPSFLNTFFGASFGGAGTAKSYREYSANPKQVAEVVAVSGSAFDLSGAPGFQGYRIGISDGCGIENDVLALNAVGVAASAVVQNEYENVGSLGPYRASIYTPPITGVRSWTSYLDGGRITRMGTYSPSNPILPMGRLGHHIYMYKALSIAANGVSCGPVSAPLAVGDSPGHGGGTAFANFLSLRSENPKRSREARIAFGLAKTDRVEVRVFDVTGRLVKTVATRTFAGGQEHVVTWDGTDEVGNKVRSGVYFYQLKTRDWTSQKKLAVLSN